MILRPRTKPAKVRIVYSHPQALTQCHAWLEKNLPKVAQSETDSTAEAVEHLLRKDVGFASRLWSLNERAAIGMAELAKRHNLRAIQIPQEQENRTRFLILSLDDSQPGPHNKTSVLFALKDKPGALYDALVPFKRANINLTKIESRPSKKRIWEYYFFVDLEGHISDSQVKRAVNALEKSVEFVKVLGSYPVNKTHG